MSEEMNIQYSPGAYSEEASHENFKTLFSFEPDPDYVNNIGTDLGNNSYLVEASSINGKVEGVVFFDSIDNIEVFAKCLLDFVKRHKH